MSAMREKPKPQFQVALVDPLEEAEILAFHVGYERARRKQEPRLSAAEAAAEIEHDVWAWMAATP